jgi:hypothetical protein
VDLATPIPGLCAVCGTTSSTLVAETCGSSYTGPSGGEYTSSGTYTDIIPNNTGCDSLITIVLTLNTSSAGTDAQTACDSFTWIDGNTYTASNNSATVVLTNAAGCDSTVTLDLTVTTIDTTLTVDGITLTADQVGAQYQWFDCSDPQMPIEGANEQSFTPSSDGSYAVEILFNGCLGISACELVLSTAVTETTLDGLPQLYPNPTDGRVQVRVGHQYGSISAVIMDLGGRIVGEHQATNTEFLDLVIPGEAGLYLIELRSADTRMVLKVSKEN